MKIKLLKDIPGYKAGTILEPSKDVLEDIEKYSYRFYFLIDEGYAEEVKDEFDIEEIRKKFIVLQNAYSSRVTFHPEILHSEIELFNAYRVVKAIIEKLNGDWNGKCSWIINYHYATKSFCPLSYVYEKMSILPHGKSPEVIQKVIELCGPELKILFGIK